MAEAEYALLLSSKVTQKHFGHQHLLSGAVAIKNADLKRIASYS
jgi:hypothetical protein